MAEPRAKSDIHNMTPDEFMEYLAQQERERLMEPCTLESPCSMCRDYEMRLKHDC